MVVEDVMVESEVAEVEDEWASGGVIDEEEIEAFCRPGGRDDDRVGVDDTDGDDDDDEEAVSVGVVTLKRSGMFRGAEVLRDLASRRVRNPDLTRRTPKLSPGRSRHEGTVRELHHPSGDRNPTRCVSGLCWR